MKKTLLRLALLAMIVPFVYACSGRLKPLSSDLVKADPQPLALVGGKVPVTISATFPPRWFNKKAVLTITPVLRYEGGETWGPAFRYQGEKVLGNDPSITYATGTVVRMQCAFDYKPAMERSELYLTFSARIGNKQTRLADLKVADGVVATEALASVANANPAIAPDAFQRIIKEARDASLMFLIQQAEVRANEINKTEIKEWTSAVKSAQDAPNQKVSVEVQAYASPDGGVDLNTKLSERREKTTRAAVDKQFRQNKIKEVNVFANYTAQDWEGFKELVQKSNVQDKDLVLRVLSMYPDAETREREIKNISIVFRQLADDILPQLRRSRLTANIEIIGKSDDEIKRLAASDPSKLNVEELLYAATLQASAASTKRIYQEITRLYPHDYRAYNNLGMLSYQAGNIQEAAAFFEKANTVKPGNAESSMNLGLIALDRGDRARAMELFGAAASVPELAQARALLMLNEGKYADAVRLYGDTKSNNAAVAQILIRDYSKATETLAAIATPDATTAYLQAVVAARTNDLNGVVTNLQKSIELNGLMAPKAARDLEFAKYAREEAFKQLLR